MLLRERWQRAAVDRPKDGLCFIRFSSPTFFSASFANVRLLFLEIPLYINGNSTFSSAEREGIKLKL